MTNVSDSGAILGADGVPAGEGAVAAAAAMPAPEAPGRKTFDRSLVEGPIGPAVWKIAWPTMLQNIIAGLQGIIDHAMVGHFVGYTANAAIGVSWQIFLVVMVFLAVTGLIEFYGMVEKRELVCFKGWGIFGGALLMFGTFLHLTGHIGTQG